GGYVFKEEIITNLQSGVKVTDKKKSEEDRTVILSDEYLSESGVQGGKVIAEHIVLGSFIFGFIFLIIGLFALFDMVFGFGFPTNTAVIIIVLLVIVMGLLFIIGGYFIYRGKHSKKLV
ncbi:MAG TPA: hypothetical protein VMT57_01900, partial [Candidatus Thermoplasmatota archaeon]|nr:hypothetical protein [Candidatus Thermoplasmatota archaeon]